MKGKAKIKEQIAGTHMKTVQEILLALFYLWNTVLISIKGVNLRILF